VNWVRIRAGDGYILCGVKDNAIKRQPKPRWQGHSSSAEWRGALEMLKISMAEKVSNLPDFTGLIKLIFIL
jgi:hypothetical protein